MNIIKSTINLGISKPFTFLHMSDTHLCLADERDGEKKIKHSKGRGQIFPHAVENMEFAVEYAQENNYMIVHTGDLIDFVSQANFDAAKDFCRRVDCFMAAGNHEFCQFVGDGAKEDAEYRNKSLADVQNCFDNDIRFSYREVNGVNFVALDNSYYLIEQWQLDALKEVTEMGKPVFLFMHTPLYTESLYKSSLQYGPVIHAMSVPEKILATYPADRYEQQKQDETTAHAFDFIKSCTNIKGIFVGHKHYDYEDVFSDGVSQMMIGCETLRQITVI